MESDARIVAVADVLGFSPLVERHRNDPAVVVEASINAARKCLHHALFRNGFPAEPPTYAELRSHPQVAVAWFSDTVFLFARSDRDEDAAFLVDVAAWFLFETIAHANARMRLGMAHGRVVIDEDNAVFVGQPIVDAARLEGAQLWSGGALHPTAAARLARMLPSLNVVAYNVPLKSGPAAGTAKYAIDWTFGIHDQLLFPWSERSATPPDDVDSAVVTKYEQTKSFHHTICRYPRCREARGLPPHA